MIRNVGFEKNNEGSTTQQGRTVCDRYTNGQLPKMVLDGSDTDSVSVVTSAKGTSKY